MLAVKAKRTIKRWYFKPTVVGTGDMADEAWADAMESLSQDWGEPPEDCSIEEEDEE